MRELPEILGRLSLATSVAIVIADPDTRIAWCNPAFAELMGAREADAVGHRLEDVLCGKPTSRNARWAFRQAIADATGVTLRILNCRADGARFRVLANIVPIRDDSGRLLQFAVLAQEIRAGAQEVLKEEAVVLDLYRTLFAIAESDEPDQGDPRRVISRDSGVAA